MRKLIYLLLFIAYTTAYSQVGINTSDPKVNFDVNPQYTVTSVDGVLFPQLSLAELTSKGDGIYNTNQTNALIFINDISTGTATGQRININSVGYYMFDGSLWQRIAIGDMKNIYEIDHQLTSNRTANLDGKTLQIRNATNIGLVNQFSIDGSTFSVDALNKKVGIGTTTPNATLDIRSNPTSTTDPGEGFIGIGTTNGTALDKGAGAIKYNPENSGKIQYSNGTVWSTLQSVPDKLNVVTKKDLASSIFVNGVITAVDNWTEIEDSENSFNAATGVFTAPRNGNYLFTFSFALEPGSYVANSVVEAILQTPNPNDFRKSTVTYSAASSNILGSASISFVISLDSGQTITPAIFQNSGVDKHILTSIDGFNNFSVSEL